MQIHQLQQLVVDSLTDSKAVDIVALDVRPLATFTDFMVVCSGNSSRHVHSIADNLLLKAKQNAIHLIGIEGERENEWILVDLGDVVIHVMQPEIRAFYNLEKLWDVDHNSSPTKNED